MLWNWIGRDLLPADVSTLTEEAGTALAAGDEATADAHVRRFQERVLVAIDESLSAAADDDAVRDT